MPLDRSLVWGLFLWHRVLGGVAVPDNQPVAADEVINETEPDQPRSRVHEHDCYLN
jgi:hypothetical protein